MSEKESKFFLNRKLPEWKYNVASLTGMPSFLVSVPDLKQIGSIKSIENLLERSGVPAAKIKDMLKMLK